MKATSSRSSSSSSSLESTTFTCCISSPPSTSTSRPSKAGRRRRMMTINMMGMGISMGMGILASSYNCLLPNSSPIIHLPFAEAFAFTSSPAPLPMSITSRSPAPACSRSCRSTALSSISSTSLQSQTAATTTTSSSTTKRLKKKRKSSSSKKNFDKQKQSSLFQTFAKYKAVQDQLSSLNLVPVPIDDDDDDDVDAKNNNSSINNKYSYSNTMSINTNTNNINKRKRREEVQLQLLEQQAKALHISKSTLSYIQLRGQKAREELLLMNMGLVHSTVNKILYKHKQQSRSTSSSSSSSSSSSLLLKNINKDDLIQEGMIGLTKAIDKFDTTKNVAFSTYATYWIEGRILRYMKMKLYFIHVPEYMQNIVLKLEKKVYELDALFVSSLSITSGSSSSLSSSGSSESPGSPGSSESFYNADDIFTRMEEMVLQDRSKMKILCQELGYDSKTVLRAFQVRRTMYNSKSNSMVALEDWMKMRGSGSSSSISSSSSSSSTSNDISSSVSISSDMSSPSASNDSDGSQVLERYQNILGQFISMREMEALSWRYGLLKQREQQQQQQQQVQSRDYEAEAEEDLFGPQGILTTSSPTIATSTGNSDSSSTVATTTKTAVASIRTSAFSNQGTQQQQQSQQTMTKGGRWGEAMSFSEVGEQMRVSAEYGRRLCASALKKLTKAAEEGHLDPAMLF